MASDFGAISADSGSRAASFENVTDEDLVRRIRDGCEESLLYLFVDRCGGLIRQLSRSYRYDGDLLQDVCVHLFSNSGDWIRLQSWQGKSVLESWVRSVATHLCLNQWRAQTKYRSRFQRLTEGCEPATGTNLNPAERLLDLEVTRSKLLRTIDTLGERDRMVILLHCLGDPPVEIDDLAQMLGVSIEAARTIKSRAIQRLRDLLREEGTVDV